MLCIMHGPWPAPRAGSPLTPAHVTQPIDPTDSPAFAYSTDFADSAYSIDFADSPAFAYSTYCAYREVLDAHCRLDLLADARVLAAGGAVLDVLRRQLGAASAAATLPAHLPLAEALHGVRAV